MVFGVSLIVFVAIALIFVVLIIGSLLVPKLIGTGGP